MNRWKIFTIFFITGAILFVLTGCGTPDEKKEAETNITSTAETSNPAQTSSAEKTLSKAEEPKPTAMDLEEAKTALLGNWYENYHSWYLEMNEDVFVLRDGMKETVLSTPYTLTEEDGTIRICPEKEELAYIYTEYGVKNDRVFATIPKICYVDDRIEMKYLRTYLPDENEQYSFERAKKGPFDEITIRDEEFLSELQGKWTETKGKYYTLYFEGNILKIGYEDNEGFQLKEEIPIHVISYDWAKDRLYLIHTDLVHTELYAFTRFEYEDGLLKTNEMVMDADFDTSIEFRKIED